MSDIYRLIARIERLESRGSPRKPVPVFYRELGESEEELENRIEEALKDSIPVPGRARCLIYNFPKPIIPRTY